MPANIAPHPTNTYQRIQILPGTADRANCVVLGRTLYKRCGVLSDFAFGAANRGS